ncbi:hypothetical protein Ae707Ps1_6274c [Pseudonocardia sp. Ae707_Ps1]|nr:hypothetical protein Ae707Ps1_6258c [Pseudonocardia sp. Ae707_Ps1]OLM08761.1 hypothetical protein Ae707Ps1_6274c [Pseudonocardia sp. Ae707_Ps1]
MSTSSGGTGAASGRVAYVMRAKLLAELSTRCEFPVS